MTKLKKVWIGGKLTDAGMADVANMTGLRELHISGGKLTKGGVDQLAALKKLEALSISNCEVVGDDGLAVLPAMTNLRRLDLSFRSREGLAGMLGRAFGKVPPKDNANSQNNLRINLQATRQIGKVKSLEFLHLHEADDQVLEGISGLGGLKELDLASTAVGNAGMQHLSGLKSLRKLDLYNTNVSDKGFQHLRGLTKLESLNLGRSDFPGLERKKGLTDEGLQYLAGMKELKTLILAGSKIKGPGLSQLAGLTNLEELALEGNPLADEGLVHLRHLTKLIDVNLTATNVDDDAALALKKALPKARIRDGIGDDVSLVKEAPRKIEDLSKTRPDFTLTARDYFAEFTADRNAAKEKYKNKVVELTGEVYRLDFKEAGVIRLDVRNEKPANGRIGGRKTSHYFGVDCFTAEPQPWARHSEGQKIKLKGRQGDGSGPELRDCVILEASPNPALVLSVEELAKECAANPKGMQEKYGGKHLLLRGEIASKKVNTIGSITFDLKTEGKVRIHCTVYPAQKKLAKSLKVGDSVTMYGQVSSPIFSSPLSSFISMYPCFPVKKD